MYRGERFNSISHAFGALGAFIGLGVLVNLATQDGSPWKVVSFSIYGGTLALLFSASTLYHSWRGRLKAVFRKIDHISIYLLIAGTYTPFTLVTLQGTLGWTLFGTVWALAAVGIAGDLTLQRGRRVFAVIVYLLMGWLALVALGPVIDALSPEGFRWLLAGGLFYTGGIVFYALDKKVSFFHGIWHLFVLAGAICHFVTVLRYVA
jgi:hemolysin III